MNLYGDWPLPQPKTSIRSGRKERTPAVSNTAFVHGIFSSLVAPGMAEAVKRSQELRANTDAEVFHQLRGAFRKLRALYWAFAPLLDDQLTANAMSEFWRLAAAAGATRDWDIAGELLEKAQLSDAADAILLAAVREKRAQAACKNGRDHRFS